jgi:hypothetical protein
MRYMQLVAWNQQLPGFTFWCSDLDSGLGDPFGNSTVRFGGYLVGGSGD